MANRWVQAALGCMVVLGFAGHALAQAQPSITVLAYNQAGVSADTWVLATTEVTRIYAEAHVDVLWMDPGAPQPTTTFAIQLLVRRRAVGGSESVMGTALGDRHETGGTAFVFYDRVLRSAHARKQDVAGVLAYAMAHEMGHLLLPSPAHSTSGLMRAGWDGDDLRHIANRSLRFTTAQMSAIRLRASTCCGISEHTTP